MSGYELNRHLKFIFLFRTDLKSPLVWKHVSCRYFRKKSEASEFFPNLSLDFASLFLNVIFR